MESSEASSANAPTVANKRESFSVTTSGHILEDGGEGLYPVSSPQSLGKPAHLEKVRHSTVGDEGDQEDDTVSQTPKVSGMTSEHADAESRASVTAASAESAANVRLPSGLVTPPVMGSGPAQPQRTRRTSQGLTLAREEVESNGQASSFSHANNRAREENAETRKEKLERERSASAETAFHPIILCTLNNLGNTCYFNSGVQILANCPAFVYAMRDSAFLSPVGGSALMLSRTSTLRTHALYKSLARLLSSMEHQQSGIEVPISPHTTLDLLGDVYPAFEGRSQQDCPEMIAAVLGNTEDEGRQDVEVDVVLRSFEQAVRTAAEQRARYAASFSPAVRALAEQETLPALMAASTSAVGSPSRRGVTALPKEPFTPNTAAYAGRRNRKTRTASNAETERLADEEMTAQLPVESSILAMPGPWGAHEVAALRLMQSVNASNAALEARVAERKGKPYDPLNGFRPPRLIRNSVTDGFKGYMLSEITCSKCGNVSRIVEPFNTIMLDIPTQQQRAKFAKRHPEIERRTENGELLKPKHRVSSFCWYNPLSYLYCIYQALASLFSPKLDYNLTLQECLDIHFEAAELTGSNKYRCESCDKVCEATKREKMVSLPEYLLIHMKRFEAGRVFGGKKNDPVIFPVSWNALTPEQASAEVLPASVNGGRRPEILDLAAYVHPDVARFIAAAPPCLQLDPEDVATNKATRHPQPEGPPRNSPLSAPFHSARDITGTTAGTASSALQGHVTSTYTLDGVVNHHGSLGGGHYTVYVRKVTEENGGQPTERWVYISDDAARLAEVDEVANSEEYVLLYRKQPMVEVHGAARELQDRARYYLKQAGHQTTPASFRTAAAMGVQDPVYVSRDWLHRAAFFVDPGPIYNHTCYCTETDRQRVASHFSQFPVGSTRVPEDVPHVHGPPAEWFYVPVEAEDYWGFHAAYGGDAPCTQAMFDAFKEDQQRFLAAVRPASK